MKNSDFSPYLLRFYQGMNKSGRFFKSTTVFFEYSFTTARPCSPKSTTLVILSSIARKKIQKAESACDWNIIQIFINSDILDIDSIDLINQFLFEIRQSSSLFKGKVVLATEDFAIVPMLRASLMITAEAVFFKKNGNIHAVDKDDELFVGLSQAVEQRKRDALPRIISDKPLSEIISNPLHIIFENFSFATHEQGFNLEPRFLKPFIDISDNDQLSNPEFEPTPYEIEFGEYSGSLEFELALPSSEPFNVKNNFDFNLDPYEDRSWRFWLQNFVWLEDFLNSSLEDNDGVALPIILEAWFRFIDGESINSEFLYHDHSLALRSKHLLDNIQSIPKVYQESIRQHLFDIALLISSPLVDNALTNHGYDQAVSLFLLSLHFSDQKIANYWNELSVSRLQRELQHAFTTDGVHVENSPAYHHGMISNLFVSLSKVVKHTKDVQISNFIKKLEHYVPFLAWIIRPDGLLPPIGDTEEKKVSIDIARKLQPSFFNQKLEGMRVFGSSYAIWRTKDQHLYLTLKSGLKSRYHRHDDDCSVTLWIGGKNLILDSGLLYYREKDPKRIHVRSASGHSGFEIEGQRPIRDHLHESSNNSYVISIDDFTAMANMGMYPGYSASRCVKLANKQISIVDSFTEKCLNSKIKQNFIIESIWKIGLEKNIIKFSNENIGVWEMVLPIGFPESNIKISDTFVSPTKNQILPAQKVSIMPNTDIFSIKINYEKLLCFR